MECILNLNKTSSVAEGAIGDIITYSIDISNYSDSTIYDIVIKDLLPEELKFILGSIKIDYKKDSYSNIISGVSIKEIDPGKNKILTFDAQISKSYNKPIQSKAVGEYKFKHSEKEICRCSYSNLSDVLVRNPSIIVSKECDIDNIQLDDILTFTISVTNKGDLDIINLFLIEEIPTNIQLIDGSFCIDEIVVNSVEIEKGVMLDGIKRGNTKIIKYSARLVSSGSSSIMYTKTKIRYSYILNNGIINYKESDIVEKAIKVAISSFKQVDIDEYLTIKDEKPEIEEINNLKVNVKITNSNAIKTPVGKSSEGQILSGYKLIVHGVLNQILEYVACDSTNSVHSDSFTVPFSSYIVLPQNFTLRSKVEVEASIENIYYDYIDKRNFFKSVTLLLVAKTSDPK